MNSRQYWEQRAAQREQEAQLIVEKYLAQMQQRLKEAQRDIVRQIEAFYARYARDNKLSLYEAKKILTSQEIEEFKQVDLARFRAMALAGNPQYENLLNAVSYRVRISRLELLLAQIEMMMLHLYGGKTDCRSTPIRGWSMCTKTRTTTSCMISRWPASLQTFKYLMTAPCAK